MAWILDLASLGHKTFGTIQKRDILAGERKPVFTMPLARVVPPDSDMEIDGHVIPKGVCHSSPPNNL
jgi:hypothetical protein